MAPAKPVVLEAGNIGSLVQHILNYHAPPSSLVVCSSKTAFLERLQAEAANMATEGTGNAWSTPTLRLLSTSRTLKLAFVPDITHLRAYLASYSTTIAEREPADNDTALRFAGAAPILAILNPIELHRPTSAFSAQGLNRTFAVAVEAAHHTGSRLILTECLAPSESTIEPQDELSGQSSPSNPWDEHVPILNVTTKRLGELSVGRTVKIRDVAARWCVFEKLDTPQSE